MATNLFCDQASLSNEASVEAFFVFRLLTALGFDDRDIKLKNSLSELEVARGRSKELYKPDVICEIAGVPRLLVEAKGIDENLDDWGHQGPGYALAINRLIDDNPLRHVVLTNGIETRLYLWDQGEPILELHFTDFVEGNPKYSAFLRALSKASLTRLPAVFKSGTTHKFSRPSMDTVKRTFLKCHRTI